MFGYLVLAAFGLASCARGEQTEIDEATVHDPRQRSGGAGAGGGSETGGASGNSGEGGMAPQKPICQKLPSEARVLAGLENPKDVFDGYTPLSITAGGSIIFNTNPPYNASGPFRNVYSVSIFGGAAKLLSSSKAAPQGALLPGAIGDVVSYTAILDAETGAEWPWLQHVEKSFDISPVDFIASKMGVGIGQLKFGPSSLGMGGPTHYRMAVSVSVIGKKAEETGRDIILLDILDQGDHFKVQGTERITVPNGHAYNPALSPDGVFMAYWRTSYPEETVEKNSFPKKPGTFELILRNIETGDEKVVESSLQPERLEEGMRYIQRISVSNEGDVVYGVQVSNADEGPNTHVHLYHADAGKIEDVGAGETPSMSGNGALMAYEKLKGKKWEELESSIVIRRVKTGLETFVVGPNLLGRCDLIPLLDAKAQGLAWYHSETGDYQVVGMMLPDVDDDGIPDIADNCPYIPSQDLTDADGDGVGKPCDPDEQ
ncbi:MAG: thrombospondin type 3 repeat-containing protein [bacterium]